MQHRSPSLLPPPPIVTLGMRNSYIIDDSAVVVSFSVTLAKTITVRVRAGKANSPRFCLMLIDIRVKKGSYKG